MNIKHIKDWTSLSAKFYDKELAGEFKEKGITERIIFENLSWYRIIEYRERQDAFYQVMKLKIPEPKYMSRLRAIKSLNKST